MPHKSATGWSTLGSCNNRSTWDILTFQFCQPSMGVDLPLLSSTNLQWNKLAGVLAYLQGQMVILQAQVLCFATLEGILPVSDILMLECHSAGTGILLAPAADVPRQYPGP